MMALELVLSSAWAMEETAIRLVLEVASRSRDVTPQALEAYRAESLDKAERARVRDGVAILYVDGPLFKRANLMTELCGATSYDVLRRDLATAVDDQNVRAILLAIDSPGGEAAGVAELASAVRAARGTKPIVAYAGDLAASAAYWLASAADRIVIGASAAVGSIGVRASMTDTSDRDARAGVRRFEIVSSQSPFKVSDPKSDDGMARIKARIDALAQVFVDTVADNRGVSVDHVLGAFGRGDVLIGQAAVAAGMADAIGTFEGVLADLSSSTDPIALIGLSTAAISVPVSKAPVMTIPTKAPPSPPPLSAGERERLESERAVEAIMAAHRMVEPGFPDRHVMLGSKADEAAAAAILEAFKSHVAHAEK